MWLFVCMWPPISCAMEKIANWNEKPKIPVNVIYTNLFPIWHYTKYVRISSVTLHILCGCLITAWPAKVICSCKHDVCARIDWHFEWFFPFVRFRKQLVRLRHVWSQLSCPIIRYWFKERKKNIFAFVFDSYFRNCTK